MLTQAYALILKPILTKWSQNLTDHYTHTLEGKDDMTSHIKSSILGSSVSFPIKNGVPQLGIWQGVYLCEHRNQASGRTIFITCIG
jgi:secondary thiamine-phosphate synthase enzyme